MGVVLPQPIQFGKYTLFERIGRGGMADVFKARVQGPAGFERVFVVKRILPHLSDDPQFTKMFIEEAKLSARLNHPNVVQVFELGSVEKEYFIAMEHVKGRDLAETMRTLWARVGPPRPELVAYVGREMCRALAYAHDLTADDGSPLGMIHRDVSPSNVMLSYEGAVKLLDFGIAKALGGESKEESGTQRGTLKGKFAYMAPEQTQGSDVDRRIDIFATGIVLHEILTGRRLFKGENDLQTVEKVRQCEVPPPSLQNPLCPPELDDIVLKALARDRDDRFQTASDMADALDDIVHATRFQPTHLAQLMRDLFPTDAGPGSTSARVSATMSGTQSSRPHSGVRSPTIPPRSISRSVSAVKVPPTGSQASIIAPTPAKSFWAKGSTWAGLGLIVVAFAGGVMWTRSQSDLQAGASDKEPVVRRVDISVTSIPPGAEIIRQGDNKKLGVTDTRLIYDYKEDSRVSIILRKEGYEDATRELGRFSIVVPLRKKQPEKGRPNIESLPTKPAAPAEPTPTPAEAPPVTPPPAETAPPAVPDSPSAPPPKPATRERRERDRSRTPSTSAPSSGAGKTSDPFSKPGSGDKPKKPVSPNDVVDPF